MKNNKKLEKLDAQINVARRNLVELEAQRQAIIDEETAMETEKQQEIFLKTAYQNETEAIFDGLKYVADYDHPIRLVFPMPLRPNMFYVYNDGLKDIRYVYMSPNVQIATEENYIDLLEPYVQE